MTRWVKYFKEYFKIPQPTTPKQFVNNIVIAFPKDADAQLDTGELVAQGSGHASSEKERAKGIPWGELTPKRSQQGAAGCY